MAVAAAAAVMVEVVIKEEDVAGAEAINKTPGNRITLSTKIRTRITPFNRINRTQILFSNNTKIQTITSVGLELTISIVGRMELVDTLRAFAVCHKKITAGMRRLTTR